MLLNDVPGIHHFKFRGEIIYGSLYSHSPKQSSALVEVCNELRVQFLKVGRDLGMQWIASASILQCSSMLYGNHLGNYILISPTHGS